MRIKMTGMDTFRMVIDLIMFFQKVNCHNSLIYKVLEFAPHLSEILGFSS